MTLDIDNLYKSFGPVRAVDGISLTVKEGEFVGIIGPSGAGKSTLLRLINQLERADAGSIAWDGEDVSRLRGQALRRWRTNCAMIFQHYGLVERLDVITNVLVGRLSSTGFFRSVMKTFPREDRARAILELERLGLHEAALQQAGTLSGGQKQRVAIARAMMQEPSILLADEPVASLDPANTRRVAETLLQINRERGVTILVNLHDLSLATSICQRIVGLSQGKVVFDGPPSALTQERRTAIFGLSEEADAPRDEEGTDGHREDAP